MSTQYDAQIESAVLLYLPSRDWRLLKAQFMAESNLNPDAVSPAGAQGIAQFMPDTWEQMVSEMRLPPSASPHDPQYAIPAGAYYMSKLLGSWSAPRPEMDRYCLALASYNAGMGNLLKAQKAAGGANDYARIIRALPSVTGIKSGETISYVRRILHYWTGMVTG